MANQLPNRAGAAAQTPGHSVRIYNKSRQTISIHAMPPGGDFFSNEQQIHISPNKTAHLPKNHLRWEQIENLRARGLIQVVTDTEDEVVAGAPV